MKTNYLSHTPHERADMLKQIGHESIADLFSPISAELQNFELDLPPALCELELDQALSALHKKNTPLSETRSFLGAGAYRHFLPAALDNIIQRPEFLTSYTPYQAEISQGTLQVIYEFQSALCTLTGMDIANASAYEGATATAEAMLMANRLTQRQDIFVSSGLHPEYKEVLKTYAKATGLSLHFDEPPAENTVLEHFGDQEPAALIVQYPNFWGHPEALQDLADWIHDKKGLLIVVVTDPVVLGLLKPPGELGADLVVGEAQAFGNAISFGGPYLGFITARQKFIRQMPGRMCGLTEDEAGQQAFSLVLQTREQHIRRERATSNICTNQGLNALAASVWLSLIGRKGLVEMANICLQRTHYFAERLAQIEGFEILNQQAFFHEFVLKTSHPMDALQAYLAEHDIYLGVPLSQWHDHLSQHLLVNVTEMNPVSDLDATLDALKAFVERQA